MENKNYYDYIIIGSSPYGLTCAYYLSKLNKKILLIDKNDTIGGSFRIDRQDGYYSELNDTYYSDSFINFDRLLLKFGTSFKKLFRPTKYTLFDLINSNNFSVSKDKILSVVNTEILHNIYIPKEPNDIKLFKIWKENLDCDIKLGVQYEIIDHKDGNEFLSIKIDNDIYQVKYLIYDQENSNTSFTNAQQNNETQDTSSIDDHHNVFYHWDSKIDLKQNNLLWDTSSYDDLVLSDYMYFSDPNSVTVFSRKHNNLNIDIMDKFNPTKITVSKCYPTDNIEILVTNAIKLLYFLEPEIKKTVILEDSYNVIDIVKFLLLIKVILFIFKI